MDSRELGSIVVLLLLSLPACGGGHRATAGMFSGTWDGHTRRLVVTSDGRGREIVDSGCCTRVVTARFRFLHVSGTGTKAVATIRFTFVRIDRAIFAETNRRPPRAGQVGTLRLRNGVITDESTTVTFCARNVSRASC
jgi:hypothetical protein